MQGGRTDKVTLTKKKKVRIGLPLQNLSQYANEGGGTLNRTAIGGVIGLSWTNHYQPESKCDSVQRKHPSTPPAKKLKVITSAGKVMITVQYWDSQAVLLVYFESDVRM